MPEEKHIHVYSHWKGMGEPRLMGVLSASVVRGREVLSFEYDKKWIGSGCAQVLDPDIQLLPGPQYLREKKPNFGMFMDSSPDRWGRMLMRRREAVRARREHRSVRKLQESDYLLGVYDEQRMGALRFKADEGGVFLNNDATMASPPFTQLRNLERACLQLEKDESGDEAEESKWLNMLIAPGSSLGGARPKAGVVDTNGALWIAKFPSRADEKNIGGWEMVVHELAALAGINVPQASAEHFSKKYHTYLTRRFDRGSGGERFHFASAMTMLGYADGADGQTGVSYLEIAEFLMRHGAMVDLNLEELWRRMVFNICVSNTDDHLRNHGFLLSSQGWVLSPAYDMNPTESGYGLSLNITEDDNSLEPDLAMEVLEYFRLSLSQGKKIFQKVKNAVKKWPKFADQFKIPGGEQDLMRSAFR